MQTEHEPQSPYHYVQSEGMLRIVTAYTIVISKVHAYPNNLLGTPSQFRMTPLPRDQSPSLHQAFHWLEHSNIQPLSVVHCQLRLHHQHHHSFISSAAIINDIATTLDGCGPSSDGDGVDKLIRWWKAWRYSLF